MEEKKREVFKGEWRLRKEKRSRKERKRNANLIPTLTILNIVKFNWIYLFNKKAKKRVKKNNTFFKT